VDGFVVLHESYADVALYFNENDDGAKVVVVEVLVDVDVVEVLVVVDVVEVLVVVGEYTMPTLPPLNVQIGAAVVVDVVVDVVVVVLVQFTVIFFVVFAPLLSLNIM